ncbi:MAG: hypothetical protein SCH39_02540 [Methanosarcinales archaeon]|nr:hypothetical protein [Methanosarcinales archaeon]
MTLITNSQIFKEKRAYKKKAIPLILMLVFTIFGFIGCISWPSGYVSYSIYITPANGSETILFVPIVIDNKSGEIAEVMFTDPRFPEGSAQLDIIDTDKGPAMKIITNEYTQIKFSKDYFEVGGSELRLNRTFSMTKISEVSNYTGKPKSMLESWVYVNSTTNQTSRFLLTIGAGNKDRIHDLSVSGRNLSNGWHLITVEEGYGVY